MLVALGLLAGLLGLALAWLRVPVSTVRERAFEVDGVVTRTDDGRVLLQADGATRTLPARIPGLPAGKVVAVSALENPDEPGQIWLATEHAPPGTTDGGSERSLLVASACLLAAAMVARSWLPHATGKPGDLAWRGISVRGGRLWLGWSARSPGCRKARFDAGGLLVVAPDGSTLVHRWDDHLSAPAPDDGKAWTLRAVRRTLWFEPVEGERVRLAAGPFGCQAERARALAEQLAATPAERRCLADPEGVKLLVRASMR
ncbi:MAG TPA: hypothetical protein VFJ85_17775 [Acidimicrobiales bacterium]|nr:hypothetical protein [Acidimicrobiales bacterium]